MNFAKYQASIVKAQALIGSAVNQRAELLRDGSRSEGWHLEQIGKVKEQTRQQVSQIFDELQKQLAQDLAATKPQEVTYYEERGYKAQAVAQEIQDLKPDQVLTYFEDLVSQGDHTKISEASRLIESRLKHSGALEFSQFKLKALAAMPEAERTHMATKAAADSLQTDLEAKETATGAAADMPGGVLAGWCAVDGFLVFTAIRGA